VLSAHELDTIKELEEQVGLCNIFIARCMNKIEELKAEKELTPTRPTNLTTKLKKIKGINGKQVHEEVEKSYIYIDEKIESLNLSIERKLKIRGKFLKDIQEIKLSISKHELDALKFENEISNANQEHAHDSNLIDVLQVVGNEVWDDE